MANVVTNIGKNIIVGSIKRLGSGIGSAEPSFTAWGTGTGTAAVADTTLFTEASEARVAGTSTVVTTTTSNDTYQVVGTITADATKTITNAGLFDASTSGNLFCKADFTGIPLTSGDSISLTFRVVIQ